MGSQSLLDINNAIRSPTVNLSHLAMRLEVDHFHDPTKHGVYVGAGCVCVRAHFRIVTTEHSAIGHCGSSLISSPKPESFHQQLQHHTIYLVNELRIAGRLRWWSFNASRTGTIEVHVAYQRRV